MIVRLIERSNEWRLCIDIMRSSLFGRPALTASLGGEHQISLRRLFAASTMTFSFRVASSLLIVMRPQSGASQT